MKYICLNVLSRNANRDLFHFNAGQMVYEQLGRERKCDLMVNNTVIKIEQYNNCLGVTLNNN